MPDIAAVHQDLLARIHEASLKAGRDVHAVRLLAASKSQSIEAMRAAMAAGVSLIGENYVQEAQAKKPAIVNAAEWHMIGHLQRNKVKTAVEIFDVIETLDSAALAHALSREGEKRGKTIRTLIEVNLAGEEAKSGVAPQDLAQLLEQVAQLRNLTVEGLMTVPPVQNNPQDARGYFCALRELRDQFCRFATPNVHLGELSMGMSNDFAVAIEEGATIVRIGTALFGPRNH